LLIVSESSILNASNQQSRSTITGINNHKSTISNDPPAHPRFPATSSFLNVFLAVHFSPIPAMVKDALANDRIIGMVLLQPAGEGPSRVPCRLRWIITH
jgi:hypothetical protein